MHALCMVTIADTPLHLFCLCPALPQLSTSGLWFAGPLCPTRAGIPPASGLAHRAPRPPSPCLWPPVGSLGWCQRPRLA